MISRGGCLKNNTRLSTRRTRSRSETALVPVASVQSVKVINERIIRLTLDYVTQLEQAKKEADQRVAHLEAELDSSRREINDLRSRLNMPPLPPPENPGLGLNVASE